MKISKNTFNLIIRFMAGLAASLVIVGAMGLLGDRIEAKRSLLQSASGVKPSAVVMTVNGEEVTAEEYLYYVSYYAQYMSYYGVTDMNMELSAGMTAADYVAMQAQNQVVQTQVVRQWCAEAGVELSEEDLAAIQAAKDSYGSEEAYLQQLRLMGISEELGDKLMRDSYLSQRLYEACCTAGGTQRPTDEALQAIANDNKLVAAKVLFVDTCEMDDAGKATAKDTMSDYRTQLSGSSDKDTLFETLAAELGAEPSAQVVVCSESNVVSDALLTMEDGDVSELLEDEEGYYVLLRCELSLDDLAVSEMSEEYTARCENAVVETVDPAYSSINVATFYTTFSAAQQALYNSTTAAAENN